LLGPDANTLGRREKKGNKQTRNGNGNKNKKDPNQTLLVTRLDADKTMVIRLNENSWVTEILPLYYYVDLSL
jgi:hypothetical protein